MGSVKVQSIHKAAAINPRKHETEAIEALLESGEFDNATQMARKVMSVAFGLLAERDWYVVGSRLDGDDRSPVTLYGLFATDAAAIKAVDKNTLGIFGTTGIFEVKGVSVRSDHLGELDDDLPKGCADCHHSEKAHDWPRRKVPGCAVAKCKCRVYVRPERVIERVEAS